MTNKTRILIVDGSRGTRRMLCLKLEKLGYEPMSAGSSNQALAKLSTTTADVICTALALPDETGLQFIAAVRKLPDQTHTPVVVVSGQETTPKDLDPTNAYQITSTVNKSSGIDHLLGKITEFCEFTLTPADQLSISNM